MNADVDNDFMEKEFSAVLLRKIMEHVKSEDEELKKRGRLEVCEKLDGFIGYLINKNFRECVKNDPDFRQDLMQSGRLAVIQALDKYDMDKSKPTTYFYYFIFHELLEQVIVMKYGMTSYRATVINKINQVNREFDLLGKSPEMEDYKRKTGLTENQIKWALEIIAVTVTSLDNPEVFEKEDTRYRRLGTDLEACSRMNAEKIIEVIYRASKDPVIALCLCEKIIKGYKIDELAQKYHRSERELRSSMNDILRKLRKSNELKRMYSRAA